MMSFKVSCVWVFACTVYVVHVCLVSAEVTRGHWISWNWRYRQLCMVMWALEII